MTKTAMDRFEDPHVVRGLVRGLFVLYYLALGAFTVHVGVAVGFEPLGWIGMGCAYLLFVLAALPLALTVGEHLSDVGARCTAALTVCAVASTWGSAAYAHAGGLGAYQPMLSTSTMLAVVLMLRGRVPLVWTVIAANVTIGVILGPFTGSSSWFNAVLPRASLTILFLATCAAVLFGPQMAEMRALSQRRRVDARDVQERRHDVAERRDRIRRIDDRVRPLLSRIAEGHEVTDDDIVDARLVEAKLRDGIRGRALDVPRVRACVWEARRRGVSVSVLDDGGLASLDPQRSAAVVDAASHVLETELAGLESGDVVARIAPAGRVPIATVVVISGSLRRRIELSDEGSVLRTVDA